MLIYKVKNVLTGQIYIGQTSKTLEQRKARHERDAQRLNRTTVKFHNALLKYGFDKFNWTVLKECNTQEELDYYEKYYIEYYDSMDREKGYNLKAGGKLGGCYNEEARKNIGKTTKEKWQNPETASKMKAGLNKATETWIQICKDKQVENVCPVCGKTFKTAPWNAHKYCSQECSIIGEAEFRKENFKKATLVNEENYKKYVKQQKELINQWVKENNDVLKNVKYNKLTFLTNLCNFLNVKDCRTVAKILGATNRKDLVKELIKINENIC